MSDQMRERLEMILDALQRIPRRFSAIEQPSDFYATEDGIDRMDGICMILIAVGEEFKKIDRKTEGKLLGKYPNVKWAGLTGVRNFLSHAYFHVNALQLYDICSNDIPLLIETLKQMIADLQGAE